MFCSNCGKEARDGDKFCWNCGRPLSGDTESEGETKEEHPSPHDTADDREIASEGEFPQDVEQAGITSSDASNDAMVGFDAGSDAPEVEEWQDVDASSFEATQETPAVTVPAPDMYQMPAQNPYQAFPQGHPQMQANPYGGGMPQGQQMSGSMPATKVPWYMTTPARIALGVLGVFMMVRGILTIGSAFTDKKPEPDDTTHSPRTVTVPPKAEQGVDGTDGGDLIDGGDGQDIIVADPDDIVISDPNDIVIRKPSSTDDSTSGNDDVTYGGGEKFDSWAEECVDENGNPTVYAIVELKGWQLETLCQEKGLEWNEGSMQWEGEDYALVVYDKSHKRMDDQAIAELGKGCDVKDAFYEIQRTDTEDIEEAFSSSLRIVTEDQERVTDGVLYGVGYGPSMKRVFIPVFHRDTVGGCLVQVVSEPAIESGAYDSFAFADENEKSGTYGDTIQEVWRHWTNRELGSSH